MNQQKFEVEISSLGSTLFLGGPVYAPDHATAAIAVGDLLDRSPIMHLDHSISMDPPGSLLWLRVTAIENEAPGKELWFELQPRA